MSGIYVYADKFELGAALLSLAAQSGKEVCAITFDQDQAHELANYGADRLLVLNGDSPLPESYAKVIAELLKKENAELFLVGSTARGRELAAKTAGYLDCGMVSDAASLAFEAERTVTTRLMYGGSVLQTESINRLTVVTVPAGKFEAAKNESKKGVISSLEVKSDQRVSIVEILPIKKSGTDLAAADKVVCIGMGLDKPEDIKMAQDLAQALGGEIGCTRGIAEERHWLPVQSYIGISGANVKPSLYISMGVSGQIQHVVGIRDSKIIVAVDTNDKAPIFKAADYGIVGDMYEIIPLLTKALKNA
jgi:electron transfer flavoprotein alpha subunit